jgi:hypothetical protein
VLDVLGQGRRKRVFVGGRAPGTEGGQAQQEDQFFWEIQKSVACCFKIGHHKPHKPPALFYRIFLRHGGLQICEDFLMGLLNHEAFF